MKAFVQKLKKIFLYAAATVTGLLVLLLAGVHYYQQDIIRLAINELNNQLRVKVEVSQIQLSAIEKFPQLAIRFRHVKIHGSLPDHPDPLAVADQLYFTFSPWSLLRQDYRIDQVYLENADVQIFLNQAGEPNYTIFKRDSSGTAHSAQPLQFDLNRVHLQQVKVRYVDHSIDQEYRVDARQATASLRLRDPDVLIHAEGDLQSQYIRIGDEKYFAGKPLMVNSELQYDRRARKLMIQPSRLQVHQSAFEVMGQAAERPHTFVDLQIKGKNTDVQTLLSLLPEQLSRRYRAYRSQGEVYFQGAVTGLVTRGNVPKVEVQFGCRNATVQTEQLGKRITQAHLTGFYTNGRQQASQTSVLQLRQVRGRLDGKPFSGNLSLTNFDKPYLKFDVKGELDVATLAALFPRQIIKRANGTLLADIRFEGNMNDLQTKASQRLVNTSGTLGVRGVAFSLAERPLRFEALQGDFSFSRNDLVVKNFTGRAGNSDFRLNGWFKNVLSYLLLPDQPLKIEADFASRFLNLDELLASAPAGTAVTNANDQYQFIVSSRLALDLTCRLDHVQFRRFRASQVSGDLTLDNSIARIRDIQLRAADGSMQLRADLDARQPDAIQVDCNASFDHIAVDSVFYMFENFDQTFIQDRHLRGNVQATVQAQMVFNRRLEMNLPQLTADVYARVADGELNGFEPMQKLSRFINQQELVNLRFSEMENTIRIHNKTVFIPKMEIRSSVAHISVEGSHTFDQQLDYRLRIPVATLFQKRRVKAAHLDENPSPAKTNLFVAIRGRAEDYKISYDGQAVREKIKEDLKKEKREFRQAFRPTEPAPAVKGQSPKTRSTDRSAEEEYFDFN